MYFNVEIKVKRENREREKLFTNFYFNEKVKQKKERERETFHFISHNK